MYRLIIAGLFLTAACSSPPAAARVERIEILSRQPFAAGAEFGRAGAYEKLRGRAWFALDPERRGECADRRSQARAAQRSRPGDLQRRVPGVATGRCRARQRHAALRGQQPRQYRHARASSTSAPSAATIRQRPRMPATASCFARALRWCGRHGRPTSPRRRATIGWCCGRRSPPRTARRSPARSPTS